MNDSTRGTVTRRWYTIDEVSKEHFVTIVEGHERMTHVVDTQLLSVIEGGGVEHEGCTCTTFVRTSDREFIRIVQFLCSVRRLAGQSGADGDTRAHGTREVVFRG